MTQIIQQITQNLINWLPESNRYYRPDELYECEFPTFIVKRIKIELERNLADSMIPPKTDWANIQSSRVQESWDEFVKAIRAEARLPASYAKTVIETAVADVLEMLVQPRKNIPEIMFGTDEELTYKQVCDRAQLVVVYNYFSTLLPRYMQKKGLDQLSKEQCRNIIKVTDQKLTRAYSPLNWAQMLEPLFKLMDGKIDTNLLRLFFEDKDKTRLARQFGQMNENIGRAYFIEVLSSPELLDFGEDNDHQSSFKNQPAGGISREEETGKNKELRLVEEEIRESKEETEAEESADKDEESAQIGPESEIEQEDNLNASFTEETDSEQEEDDSEPEPDSSLYSVFLEEGDEGSMHENKKDKDGSDIPLAEETSGERPSDNQQSQYEEQVKTNEDNSNDLGTNETEQSPEEWEDIKDKPDSNTGTPPPPQEVEQQPQEEEETPIWMNYMSEEEIAEYHKQELAEFEDTELTGDEETEEGTDEPAIDSRDQQDSGKEIDQLNKLLADDRAFFVEEIFKGSDRAFDESIEKIASFESWRGASNYIEKNIFERNLIDMYSEAAVDFTDRLHTYFLR